MGKRAGDLLYAGRGIHCKQGRGFTARGRGIFMGKRMGDLFYAGRGIH